MRDNDSRPTDPPRFDDAWARHVAGTAVQQLADSEPDGTVMDAQDALQGTEAESYFVVSAQTLEDTVFCAISDALSDAAMLARSADGHSPYCDGTCGSGVSGNPDDYCTAARARIPRRPTDGAEPREPDAHCAICNGLAPLIVCRTCVEDYSVIVPAEHTGTEPRAESEEADAE